MWSIKVFSVVLLLINSSLFLNAKPTELSPASSTVTTAQPLSNCIELNNKRCIPRVGLGTSKIGATDEEVITAVKNAIEVGYRHIDTAHFYQNEKAIGQAVEEMIKDGKVKRNELFITTKVWSNHHSRELAMQSIRRSLTDLRLDYLDLVLVHWPMTFASGEDLVPKHPNGTLMGPVDMTMENFELCYQGLEQAVEQNLTNSIGVSNFNIQQLERLLAANRTHKPTVNQVECHPFLNQQDLLEFSNKNNIYLEAYSPLRRGDQQLLENEILKQIAATHGKSVAQVILRWQLQRDIIVIPRSSKKHRMIENLSLFDFTLTEDEMKKIMSLNQNNGEGRVIKFESAANMPEYPFEKQQ